MDGGMVARDQLCGDNFPFRMVGCTRVSYKILFIFWEYFCYRPFRKKKVKKFLNRSKILWKLPVPGASAVY